MDPQEACEIGTSFLGAHAHGTNARVTPGMQIAQNPESPDHDEVRVDFAGGTGARYRNDRRMLGTGVASLSGEPSGGELQL